MAFRNGNSFRCLFLSYILFNVEIFKAFINNQPENVPKTPYLSVFIAFATSLAVTKPIYFFFFEQATKIAKYSFFMFFFESIFILFTTFGFHKKNNLPKL